MVHARASYVLRIYRRDRATREIAGVLEFSEYDTRRAFRSFEELKQLLTDGETPVRPSDDGGNQ